MPPVAHAALALRLHALAFNSTNSRWEPVLEPSQLAVRLHLAGADLGVHVVAEEPIEINISHALLSELLHRLGSRLWP